MIFSRHNSFFRKQVHRTSAVAALGLLTGSLALLTGCGIGAADTSTSGTLNLTGHVHGGQQGVAGARIYLYDAGQTGNGSAATDRLAASGHVVTTDKFGSFGITGDYTCPNTADQLYIAAVGGNPGISANNNSIALVAALGNCGALLANGANTYITINEVTTAAAAWALGAFAKSPTAVGASSTNLLGITNAMKNAALLANTTTGTAARVTGQTIESGKLYALADALSTCVNSNGSGCSGLFTAATPPGGTAPTDTFTAALNIVHYPANNVAAVFQQIPSMPPFATTLTAAPNDWTMSDTIALPDPSGNGTAPLQLAIDGTGTVWTVDRAGGLLDAVTPQGALLGQFGSGLLSSPYGVTVNAAGHVWVSNSSPSPDGTVPNGYYLKFQSTTGSAPGANFATAGVNGTPYFYGANTIGPAYLASDSNGSIVGVDEFGGSYTEVVSDAGAFTSTAQGDGPYNAVFDTSHGLWIPDLDHTGFVLHVPGGPAGTGVDVACCQQVGQMQSYALGAGLGLDLAGNLWIDSFDGYGNGYVSAVSNGNTVLLQNAPTDNISSAAVTGDAGGVMWFANAYNETIAGISSGTGTGVGAQTIGTSVTPANGLGLDAGIGYAIWIQPDASGNLWLSDADNATLVLFFGLATPTATPQLALPTAP